MMCQDPGDLGKHNNAIHKLLSCPKCNFDYRGWMVVLASFLCVAIVDGVGYTTGLMLERLLSELTLESVVLGVKFSLPSLA